MVRGRGRLLPALIVLGGGLLALAGQVQARERLTGEQELAKMLAGRGAGKPVNCLMLTDTHDSTVIDKTAIVYRVGRVLYVNRPRHPESLDSDAVQVMKL